jgi:hypothetical protein
MERKMKYKGEGNTWGTWRTLWKLYGNTLGPQKKPKNSFPPNPKEALLSINLHVGYMKILLKLFSFCWSPFSLGLMESTGNMGVNLYFSML